MTINHVKLLFIVTLFLLFFSCSDSSVNWIDPPIEGEPAHKEWGFHQIDNGEESFRAGIESQLSVLNGGASFVATFSDLPNPIAPSILQQAFEYDLTPIISFEPSITERGIMQNEMDSILAGKWDKTFTNWATELSQLDGGVILRFGYEMNGDWFAYGQQPEKFIAVWRYVHSLFKSVHADNVLWMFSPNVLWQCEDSIVSFEKYYPGDSVVDLLGLDGYNFGDNHDKYHCWSSFPYIFEESIECMQQYNKPLYIAEIGCAHGPQQHLWLDDFLTRVSRDERVQGFLYFNQHTTSKGEPDWCLTHDSLSLNTFINWNSFNQNITPSEK